MPENLTHKIVEKMLENNPETPTPDATIGVGPRFSMQQELSNENIEGLAQSLLNNPRIRRVIKVAGTIACEQ